MLSENVQIAICVLFGIGTFAFRFYLRRKDTIKFVTSVHYIVYERRRKHPIAEDNEINTEIFNIPLSLERVESSMNRFGLLDLPPEMILDILGKLSVPVECINFGQSSEFAAALAIRILSVLRFMPETTTDPIPQIQQSITALPILNMTSKTPTYPVVNELQSGNGEFMASFNLVVGIGISLFLLVVIWKFIFTRRRRIKRAISVLCTSENSFDRSFSSVVSREMGTSDALTNSRGYGTSLDLEANVQRGLSPHLGMSNTNERSEYVTCRSICDDEVSSNPRNLPATARQHKYKPTTDI